jgi:hypothetical protein
MSYPSVIFDLSKPNAGPNIDPTSSLANPRKDEHNKETLLILASYYFLKLHYST